MIIEKIIQILLLMLIVVNIALFVWYVVLVFKNGINFLKTERSGKICIAGLLTVGSLAMVYYLYQDYKINDPFKDFSWDFGDPYFLRWLICSVIFLGSIIYFIFIRPHLEYKKFVATLNQKEK